MKETNFVDICAVVVPDFFILWSWLWRYAVVLIVVSVYFIFSLLGAFENIPEKGRAFALHAFSEL